MVRHHVTASPVGSPYAARWYQGYDEGACGAVWDFFHDGKTGNPLVALATGTGKSYVLSELTRGMVDTYPGTNVLHLTHVKELISNNMATFKRHAPHLAEFTGAYSSGLKLRDTSAQITFAGIQSVANKAALFQRTNIVFVDEAHLIGNNAASRYNKFLKALRIYNPKLRVVGLTATPYRMGMGMLVDGPLFDEVVYDITEGEAFMRLVDEGYLAPLVPKRTDVVLDTANIKLTGGDYNDKQVQQALAEQGIVEAALKEALVTAADRKHWVIFANSIENTELVASLLRAAGVSAWPVHSKMPEAHRDAVVAAYLAGEIQCVVNKDILTTGFDAPHTDCMVFLRPTRSPGLWVQMLGRGTRPSPTTGKEDCLVLDFVGNTQSMGPINYAKKPKPRRGVGGEPPVKDCPGCGAWVHASLRLCPHCGHEFPPPETKLSAKASKDELMRRKQEQKEREREEGKVLPVTHVTARIHQKVDAPDSLQLMYYAAGQGYPAWVSPEHPKAKYFADKWWQQHRIDTDRPMPPTAEALLEAFENEGTRPPYHIRVVKDGKYWRITDYDFMNTAFKFEPTAMPRAPATMGAAPDSRIKDDDIPF